MLDEVEESFAGLKRREIGKKNVAQVGDWVVLLEKERL
jgi:hypothetical protein